jgi:hypothetical protein
MSSWDRSMFAIDNDELEIEEAIRAMERAMKSPTIKGSTRVSLGLALEALRADKH